MYWMNGFMLYIAIVGQAEETVESYKKIWYDSLEAAKSFKRPVRNVQLENVTLDNCTDNGTYDFIIVGAGSAGAVLANRLSENPHWSILLLEAGGNETIFSLTPATATILTASRLNWGYLTTPQLNACFGMNNNSCDYTRGKALGGSSSINLMLYVRGNSEDFNNWARMGNKGWSYEDVLPYFIKAENSSIVGDPTYRGIHGPLSVSYPQPPPPLMDTVLNAWEEYGINAGDYNGKDQFRISRTQTTIRHGRRDSTNQAYLQPILNIRKNLHLITNAFVTKLLFINNYQTDGVQFVYKGSCYKARASIEVIVSSGSINTPQILMLSGIGPKEELKKHNISVLADLPVGKSLQDHIGVTSIPILTNVSINTKVTFDTNVQEFLNGYGVLTYPGALEIGFKKPFNKKLKYPELENLYKFVGQNLNLSNYLMFTSNLKKEMADTLSVTAGSILCHYILLHEKSVGEVTLQSANPIDFPIINPNYFSDKSDIETIYKGIMADMKLLQTHAYRRVNATLGNIPIPACKHLKGRKFWYCVIQYKATSFFHPTGTCKMGVNKTTSVVDYNLKVYGIEKLRVVDASVIPNTTSGHLNAVVIMIAEKLADEIKKIHK